MMLLLFITLYWMYIIKKGMVPQLDLWSRPFVEKVAYSPVYTIFRWITEFGSFHVLLPLTITMIFVIWFVFRDYVPAITFGVGVLSAHLLNQWIKALISRERPSTNALLNAEGFSFPSGHSMVTIVCYGLLAYFLSKRLRTKQSINMVMICFSCFIFSIGFSRYILNVHYITDIISGFLLGFILLQVIIYVYEKIQNILSGQK